MRITLDGTAQYNAVQNAAEENRLAVDAAQVKMATDTDRQITDLRTQGEFAKANQVLEISQAYLQQLMSLEQWAAEYNLSAAKFQETVRQWENEFALSVGQVTGSYQGQTTGNGVPQLPGGAGTSAGTSLMPQTGAPSNSLINIRNRDIVAIAGALQERGVGARDAILTAIDLAEIKRKAGENALTMTEKAFDEAIEKGFNYDIMEEIRETYSDELKEELKSGRAREESKEEFIRRATAEGYTTYEGKKGTYGFRRAGDLRWGDRATARYYYEAQREFRELGLDITFIDGEVWWSFRARLLK